MAKHNTHLKWLAARSVIYLVTLTILTFSLVMLSSIIPPEQLYEEGSVLEWVQLLFLLSSVVILGVIAHRYQHHRPLAIALASCFLAACIRENDAFFDRYLFRHAWKMGVVIVVVVGVRAVLAERKLVGASLRECANWLSSGVMLSGFMVVFVFSRILGYKVWWMAVMGDGYTRVVTRVAEESVELLGYYLLLIGVLEYALTLKRLDQQRSSSEPSKPAVD